MRAKTTQTLHTTDWASLLHITVSPKAEWSPDKREIGVCAERPAPVPGADQPPSSSRVLTDYCVSGLTIYHMVEFHRNDLFTGFVAFSRKSPSIRTLPPGVRPSTGQTSANPAADLV